MTITHLLAEAPFIAFYLLTFCAFAAAGTWHGPRQEAGGHGGRAAGWRAAAPFVIGALLAVTILVLFPRAPLPHDAEVPTASYRASSALRQLAINATMVAPFVGWVMWRRQGVAEIGRAHV